MTTATPPGSPHFEGVLAGVFYEQAGADAAAFVEALASFLTAPEGALPVSPSDDRTVWGSDGSADLVAVADVVARAHEDLGRPWGVPLATAAARIHDDGDREGWESVVFARQFRLARAAIAATHHGQDDELGARFLAEVLDGVWLICEQSSWCWPAHDDAFRERGSVLPTVTEPYLDLGAGEVIGLLAWIVHLLGDRLEARYPGIRSRIRHEARVRGAHAAGSPGDERDAPLELSHGSSLNDGARRRAGPGFGARTLSGPLPSAPGTLDRSSTERTVPGS